MAVPAFKSVDRKAKAGSVEAEILVKSRSLCGNKFFDATLWKGREIAASRAVRTFPYTEFGVLSQCKPHWATQFTHMRERSLNRHPCCKPQASHRCLGRLAESI